ncbi:DoxX family protein [Acuticoccus sp. I52.16.1]|uniref:DoxX family protein n=1 Tax=Acuticoccus sp. I52.16.1 TaxID=2928472 RepID=UPI001FD3D995|nr:DoxX family protein [Acuticoccus sp. I52.16.1]UOM34400.1 DoxX family protein [Acuticoccus sp. I52.16.1]
MLVRLHNSVFRSAERLFGPWLLGTLGRIVFAGVFLVYFLNSARTKLGDGVFGFLTLSDGAYVQILPLTFEAAGYDRAALSGLDVAIVAAGTYAEIVLPILIVVGLFTRLAALGMIGFIAVMTYVDIRGHTVDATTIGSWFDNVATSAIADQRALWAYLLLTLVMTGPGPISLDRFFTRRGHF